MIRYFLNICCIVTIKESQFYTMLSSILSGQIKDYFVYNINQKLTFAEIYIKIMIKFDIEVNKAQYYTDWSLIIYSIFKMRLLDKL